MAGIIGDLCSNEKELKRAASERRREYIKESVHHDQVETYERKGWEVIREGKINIRMQKRKPLDELFEDRVWMIFYNLGFSCMNRDRNCRLEFDSYKRQIDVLARDEDTENIFVVQCISSEKEGPINVRDDLEHLAGESEDIQKAIWNAWGRKCGRINLVVAISSQDKKELDEEYVKAKRDKNLFLWSKTEIKYIEDLIRQVGSIAKYQLYSVIFAERKQRSWSEEQYPAIRGRIGDHTCYNFLIPAKKLLKYVHVHHRHLTGIAEASQAYQRMLKSSKLKGITKFIDDEEGYFPNNIIVNFSKGLRWDLKESFGEMAMGVVTLPEYFGSAWIIDGQHRVYGAAAAKAYKEVLLPVLAFENMEPTEQANLFVEINKEQTSVSPSLLWDLYSDIYQKSPDEKQKLRYQIAETAKSMEVSGPLKGYIDIPSKLVDRPTKLSLTTVCHTIEKYSPWDHLKHPTDETKTPENAARLINAYFEALKSLWPEDWERGNEGVLLTNAGFAVFMIVFRDIVKHIANDKQGKSLLQVTKTKEFEKLLRETYLTPPIEYLKSGSKDGEKLKNAIKSQTGTESQRLNAAELELIIQRFVPEFSSALTKWINNKLPTTPTTEFPAISSIEEKSRRAEPALRNFVLERLKRNYGSDKWWKQGLPHHVKEKLDEMWRAEVKRKPYLRTEENERKFEFLGLGDIIDVVAYRQNWEQIFEEVFVDKGNFERRIKDIMALRNPSSHARQIDDQDMLDGMNGLSWLSRCIDDPELNPYV